MLHKNVLEVTRRQPVFSLEKLGLIKVVTILCKNRQLLRLILKCKFQTEQASRLSVRKGKEWEAVKAKASELVSQLDISAILQGGILDLLWPMCYRILLWRSTYAPSISNKFLKCFFWTNRGRIDNARTVQYIIADKNVSVRNRFVLACSVCLSVELHEIWKELSTEDRVYFSTPNNHKISPLLLFWARTLGIGPHGHINFHNLRWSALQCAIKVELLQALKYIFATSGEETKKFQAVSGIRYLINKLNGKHFLEEDENDIGCLLFFELCDTRQETKFNEFTILVLSLLLHASEYELCRSLLEERLESLSEQELSMALRMIFYTYHLEVKNGEDIRELFVDVWKKIPLPIKNSIKDSSMPAEFLCVLIKDDFPFIAEKETDLTSLDLESGTSVNIVNIYKWEFLHFLIQEVTTIACLKNYRTVVLPILEIKQNNMVTWGRILRFVGNFASKIPKPRE